MLPSEIGLGMTRVWHPNHLLIPVAKAKVDHCLKSPWVGERCLYLIMMFDIDASLLVLSPLHVPQHQAWLHTYFTLLPLWGQTILTGRGAAPGLVSKIKHLLSFCQTSDDIVSSAECSSDDEDLEECDSGHAGGLGQFPVRFTYYRGTAPTASALMERV